MENIIFVIISISISMIGFIFFGFMIYKDCHPEKIKNNLLDNEIKKIYGEIYT